MIEAGDRGGRHLGDNDKNKSTKIAIKLISELVFWGDEGEAGALVTDCVCVFLLQKNTFTKLCEEELLC